MEHLLDGTIYRAAYTMARDQGYDNLDAHGIAQGIELMVFEDGADPVDLIARIGFEDEGGDAS